MIDIDNISTLVNINLAGLDDWIFIS